MNDQLKAAINASQRAQRNYDLSKTISQSDLETLIYAACNSPSKQNETHYSLSVYTNPTIIQEIYTKTKYFSLWDGDKNIDGLFEDRDGTFWQSEDRSVTNSQILANALFVFVDDEGIARGGEHLIAKTNENSTAYISYQQQKNFSIGIAVGELILSAHLLGYKTGLCSAFSSEAVAKIINVTKTPKLLVGVGYPNINTDRRLHPKVLNKDVPSNFRTGNLDENWRFPSFEKNIKVTINNNT